MAQDNNNDDRLVIKSYLIDDSEIFNTRSFSDCMKCIHWVDKGYNSRICLAFDKIPVEIWNGVVKHTEPIEGDRGFRFYDKRICTHCVNYIKTELGRVCNAFDEIPLEIWNGQIRHTEPIEGDKGYQFVDKGA